MTLSICVDTDQHTAKQQNDVRKVLITIVGENTFALLKDLRPNFSLFTNGSENIVSVLIIGGSSVLWSRLSQPAFSIPHP